MLKGTLINFAVVLAIVDRRKQPFTATVSLH